MCSRSRIDEDGTTKECVSLLRDASNSPEAALVLVLSPLPPLGSHSKQQLSYSTDYPRYISAHKERHTQVTLYQYNTRRGTHQERHTQGSGVPPPPTAATPPLQAFEATTQCSVLPSK